MPKSPFVRTLMWVVPAAVLVAAVLMLLNQATAPPSAGSTRASAAQGNALGPADAPVKVEVFSDFQCPHCRDYAAQVEPRLFQEYVDTGKVQFVYRHLIVIGPDSVNAAQAAECAGLQGQFWPYHDKLFAVQGTRGAYTLENLKAYAGELGLDQDAFTRCLEGGQMMEKVRLDSQEGANRGARSTPTTFINGQMVVGNQPYDAYKRVIDAALAG